jgi:hypothetical protein
MSGALGPQRGTGQASWGWRGGLGQRDVKWLSLGAGLQVELEGWP